LGKLDDLTGGLEQLAQVGQEVLLMSKMFKAVQVLSQATNFSEGGRAAFIDSLQRLNTAIDPGSRHVCLAQVL
jgi:hypothetical protein